MTVDPANNSVDSCDDIILGIDRFMSEARALTNVIGNGVATLVVAKWTGELDAVTMRSELQGKP